MRGCIADRGFGQVIGGGANELPMAAQLRMVHAELDDTAVVQRRRGAQIAMGIGQLRELPQQRTIGGQPQGELLGQSGGAGRQLPFLSGGELARFEFTLIVDVAHAEQIIEIGRPGRFLQAQADEFQVQFLGRLELAGRQSDRVLQRVGGLGKVALQLPGSSEVGRDVEMVGMFALCGPQRFDRLVHRPEAHVESAEIRLLSGAEAAFLFELGGFFQIVRPGRILVFAELWRYGDIAQRPLIEQETAPLRW